MTKTFLLGASSLLGLLVAAPAIAQDAGHAGHTMPMPAPAEPAAPAQSPTPDPHAGHDMTKMDSHAGHDMTAKPTADPHAGHNIGAMNHDSGHAMSGALGNYPGGRESSGTSWQPDSAEHRGLMTMQGDWLLMAHADLFGVYSNQGSRRGNDKLFGAGMIMGMARRPVGGGTLQLRAGLSPDPLMGKSGYPLLLASGETADGVNRLIDRQHPHDFVMELSASLSQPIGPNSSVFLYGGLPGEPAFGPGAFMHRESIMDSPEAPISHHWLDSQHISFGVLTGGVVLDRFKIEASRFNGREPDQYRWNIETAPLDSTAVRVSVNPTRDLALQASWARLKDPEQLEPGVNQTRLSASGIYATDLANGWRSASTLAWGRKSAEGHDYDAFVAETSLKKGLWTLFGRGEITENSELLPIDHEDEEHDGEAFTVGKLSAGAIRDFQIAPQLKFGVGGLIAVNFVPEGLRAEYGKARPLGGMAFVRLKVG